MGADLTSFHIRGAMETVRAREDMPGATTPSSCLQQTGHSWSFLQHGPAEKAEQMVIGVRSVISACMLFPATSIVTTLDHYTVMLLAENSPPAPDLLIQDRRRIR